MKEGRQILLFEKRKPSNVWYKPFPWHSDMLAGKAQVDHVTLMIAPLNWSVPVSHNSEPKHSTDLFHGRHFVMLYSRKSTAVINNTDRGFNPLSRSVIKEALHQFYTWSTVYWSQGLQLRQRNQSCYVVCSSGGATQAFEKIIMMISSMR